MVEINLLEHLLWEAFRERFSSLRCELHLRIKRKSQKAGACALKPHKLILRVIKQEGKQWTEHYENLSLEFRRAIKTPTSWEMRTPDTMLRKRQPFEKLLFF